MTIEGPFDDLSFTRTFSRVFSIWKDRLGYFSIIGFVVLVLFAALVILGFFTVMSWLFQTLSVGFELKQLSFLLVLLELECFLWLLPSILGEGVAVAGVVRMYVGQSPTVMESFKEAWSRKYPLFMSGTIIGLGLFAWAFVLSIIVANASMWPNRFYPVVTISSALVGLVVVVAGSYVALGVSMTYAAIITEGISSPMQAIRRSWELASGNRCYIFCTTFLLRIVVVLLPFLVFFPLGAILRTVIYLNLRVRHESMNLEVLSKDLMEGGSSELSTRKGEGGVDDPSTSDLSSCKKESEEDIKLTKMAVATELV